MHQSFIIVSFTSWGREHKFRLRKPRVPYCSHECTSHFCPFDTDFTVVLNVISLLGLYHKATDPDNTVHWSDGTEASLYDGLWLNNEPDISSGNCVAGQLGNDWSLQNCDRRLPFVCRQDGAIKSKYMYMPNIFLSYDVAVMQWITSCHKNRMTTHYITF